MKNVYVVVGSSGSYEDRDEWSIAAYGQFELAEKHKQKAQQWWARKEGSLGKRGIEIVDMLIDRELHKLNPWDGYESWNADIPDYRVDVIPYRTSVVPRKKGEL